MALHFYVNDTLITTDSKSTNIQEKEWGKENRTIKNEKIKKFQSNNENMKQRRSADEGHSAGWKLLHFINFHRYLRTPAMSTDSSQVSVALFPAC